MSCVLYLWLTAWLIEWEVDVQLDLYWHLSISMYRAISFIYQIMMMCMDVCEFDYL